ncbi:MAG TPA: PPC domain-containing protein [Longimicrobiaceae bacterium]|jgi:hypothetical protein|nr:PPC domain-containing protein [Longimicrobiaceae bacterium]
MNSTHLRTAALAACLAAAATAPAARAQGRIAVGQRLQGSLTASSPKLTDGSYYQNYTLRAQPGQTVTVTLRSTAFDAYLAVGQMQNGQWSELDSDDDGAGGTDAQVQVAVPAGGELTIRANSLEGGATGAYTVQVAAGGAASYSGKPRPAPQGAHTAMPTPQPIRIGGSASGSLDEGDAVLESDNTRYDLYSFRGRAGQRVQVTMRSGAFDSYMAFGRIMNGSLSVSDSDDDGAGGNDSRVIATLPADGEYVIRANSLTAEGRGGYTVTVEELPPAPPAPDPRSIRGGETVEGTLDANDPQADDHSSYDAYVYHGRAGERLTVTMTAGGFDAYLAFGTWRNGAFSQTDSDDDGAGGTNSKLEVTLPADGDYVIRANSLSAGATGPYTLRVESRR